MDFFSTSMITTQSMNDSTEPLITENPPETHKINVRRSSRSGLRNSDTWVRKRALMHRGYEWTTTFEGVESTPDADHEQNSTNSKSDIPHEALHRRRSTRRLPDIPNSSKYTDSNIPKEVIFNSTSYSSNEYPYHPLRENSLSNRSNRSKSIDSDSSLKTRSIHVKLSQIHQSPNAKSVDVSNLSRRKSCLVVSNTLLPQRSLDYPCIVRKTQDLSDMVRRRMLHSKINKQQGDQFSISLEREHVPKVPRKIVIKKDNSIEISLR
jgi:hypothetical protein